MGEIAVIAYVNGILESIEEGLAIVDVGGVGMNVFISGSTMDRMPGIGEAVKLYTYTSVKEDSFTLYGFLSRDEKQLETMQRTLCVSIVALFFSVVSLLVTVLLQKCGTTKIESQDLENIARSADTISDKMTSFPSSDTIQLTTTAAQSKSDSNKVY